MEKLLRAESESKLHPIFVSVSNKSTVMNNNCSITAHTKKIGQFPIWTPLVIISRLYEGCKVNLIEKVIITIFP